MSLDAILLISLLPAALLGFVGGLTFSYYKQKKQGHRPQFDKAIEHGMTGFVAGVIWPLSLMFFACFVLVSSVVFGLQWIVWKTGIFVNE